MKQCKGICGQTKPLTEFYKEKKGYLGYRSKCKTCFTKQAFESVRKTPESFLNKTWLTMNARVSGSGDEKQRRLYEGLEICDKGKFIKKFIKNRKFLYLHRKYVESNFEADLAPSPDRIKTDLGYTIENIRMLTWKENRNLSTRNLGGGKNVL